MRRKSLPILLVPIIFTLASMPFALAATLNYKVTFEVNVSGPCLVTSYKVIGGNIIGFDCAEGVGYVTMIGEALVKGPIPCPFPGSTCLHTQRIQKQVCLFIHWLMSMTAAMLADWFSICKLD